MTLQSSGSIKFSDIAQEFGRAYSLGSYRVYETLGSLTRTLDDAIPYTGTIKFSDFYGKKLNVVVNVYSGTTDYHLNARSLYDSNSVRVVGGFRSKPSSSSNTKVFVHVNKSIGSLKGSEYYCALRTGNWNPNTELYVDVGSSGALFGAGGDGGKGRVCDGGYAGSSGSSALGVEYYGTTVRVFSGGYIQCGYGGGGGGGGGFNDPDKNTQDHASSGGGGGGGAGLPAGSGGPTGDGAFGSGSNGSAGNAGSSTAGGSGGSGGGGGGSSGGNGGVGGSPSGGPGSGGGGSGNVCSSNGTGGGSNGAAIRKTSGISFSLVNYGTIYGSTSADGVA